MFKNGNWLLAVAFLTSLLLIGSAYAEGPVIDPEVTPTVTLDCVYPTTREDDTSMAREEVAAIIWFQSNDNASWGDPIPDATDCPHVVDITALPDGQYYNKAKAVDIAGRTSRLSDSYGAYEVKRPAPPNPPVVELLLVVQ